MHLNHYQERAYVLAVYPHKESPLFQDHVYLMLGLSGEAGEVAEKCKKVIRDQGGVLNLDSAEAIAYELGDVLWYLSVLATKCGFTLGEIAEMNLTKLESRKERGALQGSGDQR